MLTPFLLVLWAVLFVQPTPVNDPRLSLTAAESLHVFSTELSASGLPADRAVEVGIRIPEPSADVIEPALINAQIENRNLRRLERIIASEDGLWWGYGLLNRDRAAWYFRVQANTVGWTPEQIEEAILTNTAPVTAPLYSLYAESMCRESPDSSGTPAHSLPPVRLDFAGGQGWATLQFCVNYEWFVGDGPECGGYGAAYVPQYWYTFVGLTADHASIISASVSLIIRDTPRTEVAVNLCTSPDEVTTSTYTPPLEEWEALGWHEEDWPPRLNAEAQAAFAAAALTQLAQQLDHDPEAGTLAGAFAALNETFATLEYEPAG